MFKTNSTSRQAKLVRYVLFLLITGLLLAVLSIYLVPTHGLQVTYLSRPFNATMTTLYLLDVDQHLTTKLLEDPSLQRYVWSPDGRYVLWAKSISFEGGSRDPLYIFEVATRRKWLLVENAFAYGSANWSPDSRRIVYTKPFEQGVGVFTIDIAGTDEQFVTSTDVYPWYPTWSPDGQWIAFTDYFDNLYIVSAAGGTAKALGYALSGANYGYGRLAPLWSADSQRLIYYRDGTVYCTLIDPPVEEACATNVNSPPSIAPDNRLAFTSESPAQLWILSPPELEPRSYTIPDAVQLVAPRWSSDGQHILLLHVTERYQIAPYELFDFEIATGRWVLLDTLLAEQATWRP